MTEAFGIFQKASFRTQTVAKEIRVFFQYPGMGGNRRKESTVYLGKTNSQTFFNDTARKAFCLTVQCKPGVPTPTVPKFFFDVSAHCGNPDFMFLDRNFRPVSPSPCVEVTRDKCTNCDTRYVCEEKMYLVYKDETAKVRVEEWVMENDTRYHGAGMLQINKLSKGPKYLNLRRKFLRQR